MTLTRQQILDLLAKESKQDAAKAVLDALNSKDFATEDKLEAVRSLLAGTITTEVSNFPATQDVQLTGSTVEIDGTTYQVSGGNTLRGTDAIKPDPAPAHAVIPYCFYLAIDTGVVEATDGTNWVVI